MIYSADIAAGSLKLAETRIIAGLLLKGLREEEFWNTVMYENILQARNVASARRYARLILNRLSSMTEELWILIHDGSKEIATHAAFAAAVKHSRLLGDFLDLVVRQEYRTFGKVLPKRIWEPYLEDCRARDPEMPQWNDSTIRRLRSSVFQILAQAGFIDNTRSLNLQNVRIVHEVVDYLEIHQENYVLRCFTISP